MFITFEGGEGSGKSSALEWVGARLKELTDIEIVLTREPGSTDVGRSARGLLLDSRIKLEANTELLLFAADRAHNLSTIIRPALARGAIVISDRYVDSTYAYQSSRGTLLQSEIDSATAIATRGLLPALTLLFDVPTSVGLKRAKVRNAAENSTETRFDDEVEEFHSKVRKVYLERAHADPRFKVIDATQSIDAVREEALHVILSAINRR